MKIFCVVSDPAQFAAVQRELEPHGVACVRFTDEYMLLRRINRLDANALLFDPGFDTAMEERLLTWMECHPDNRPPVIWRCASYNSSFAVRALRGGAADVLDRETDANEASARILAAARRVPQDLRPRALQVAGFELDLHLQAISDNGRPIEVSPREFALAWLFFSRPTTCLARDTIGIAVWGLGSDISGRTMEQHVHRLRKKLGLGRQRGVSIRAVYGQGYRLRVDPTRSSEPASHGDERSRSDSGALHPLSTVGGDFRGHRDAW